MKQQGHIQNMQCLSYSPDGHSIATGGQDGKLKIWSENTGFCFVTFTEHTSTITGVVWTEGGKAIISASLDGTVRAFDMKRYRNFRTFTSTKNMQFSCIAVDSSSELLCAGTQDDFVVCLWSIKTGRLLDMLSGHTAPVSSVVFAPTDSILASVSWDKTVHVWDVCNSGSGKESLKLQAEGLCAKFSPDGGRLAVATMNSKIIVYDWKNATEVCSIDGKFDLDPGRADRDIISVAKSAPSKSFTTLAFTADGEYLLAGGQSRHICIYHVEEAVIVRKYQITSNLSLDAIADDIDRRKMSEFGNLALIDMSDSDVSDDELREQRKLKLPGTRTGDYSQRRGKPEVNVTSVQFSPTGRCFACCSTEGLLLYSLDKSVHFDPFLLDQSITPDNIRLCVRKSEFSTALVMAIKLNEKSILCDVIERTPSDQVQVIAQNMPLVLIERFLRFLSNRLSESECRCLELYLTWINLMFRYHGPYLKTRSIDFIATFTAFQQSLNRKLNDLSKVSQFNNSSTAYITSILQLKQKKKLKMQVDKTDIDDIDDVLIG